MSRMIRRFRGLALTRREGEQLVIGEPDDPRAIRIGVARVEDGRVRLVVDAPRDVPVHRVEVLEGMAGEGAAA